MRDRPVILAVDDTPENLEILKLRLEANGYDVATAADGEEGLSAALQLLPDLILLDIMMPKRDGISVVRELKGNKTTRGIPVILVTALADTQDVVKGLDAGGDDYLTKPFEHAALLARVRSMLRQKAMHDTIQEQTSQLAAWSRILEERVAAQVEQIERISRLRRFLPEKVAEIIVNSEAEQILQKSHRCEVTVAFCDLRGFTAFAETAEPEEVMNVLREYHACLGSIIDQYAGTLERFMGDGLLVVFNDPVPQEDHVKRAVRMASAMRHAVDNLLEQWRRVGHELGFGIGIASGHATIGMVGFDKRIDYSVIGSVPNLAARLCALALPDQILLSPKVAADLDSDTPVRAVGEFELKGFHRVVKLFELMHRPSSTVDEDVAK